jgi:hypothetical protein
METSSTIQIPKPAFFPDLWSEISTLALFLGEITFATILFCTLFNRSMEFFEMGIWFFALGFGTYITGRLAGYFFSKRWQLIVINVIWIVAIIILFSKFVLFAHTGQGMWSMLVTSFVILSKQPVLQSLLWQMVFVVLLLRRGFTLASSTSNSWRAIRSFQLGMLVFFFFGFTTTWDNFLPNLTPFLLYLLFAITSLTSARLASISNQSNRKASGLKRSWFAWILALTLLLIILGSSIGWLTGVAFVSFTNWLMRIAYGMGVSLLVLFFSPLIALIGLLLPWLDRWLKSLTNKPFGLEQLQFIQSLNKPDPIKAAQVNDLINQIVTIVLIAALIITSIIVIIGARRRALRNRSKETDDLVSRAAERKLGRAPGMIPGLLSSRLASARRWLAAARIRRIYQNLMEYCQKLDNPRLPAFTPHEFLPQLIALFPEHTAQVTMLTDVYQQVRYGEIPESLDELQQIVVSWNEIKKEAEIRVKERHKRLKKN